MEILPAKRQRSLPLDLEQFFKEGGLPVQMRVMFYVGISSKKHFRMVISVHPKFKKITEYEDFPQKMNIFEVPWMSWKSPTSSEYEFLARCHRAGNPEIFLRLLIVDVFEHNRFIRVNELLDKVIRGEHRDAPYAAWIFRGLTNDEDLRAQAIHSLETIMAQDCGKWYLRAARHGLCSRLYDYYNGFTNQDRPPLRRYCELHPLPHINRRMSIDCVRCLADLACSVYEDRALLRIILSGED